MVCPTQGFKAKRNSSEPTGHPLDFGELIWGHPSPLQPQAKVSCLEGARGTWGCLLPSADLPQPEKQFSSGREILMSCKVQVVTRDCGLAPTCQAPPSPPAQLPLPRTFFPCRLHLPPPPACRSQHLLAARTREVSLSE